MQPIKKNRLDQILVDRGLAPTKTKAQAMILAGLVMVNGETVTKAGTSISLESEIVLKETLKYVSRGGLKLEGALKHFEISVKGLEILDVGASTGGFTDCLLQEGAKKIYAIDVGRGQLDASLRNHPQVEFKESFHVRELSPETFGRKFGFVVMDVSFISLKKVLPFVVKCLEPGATVLALVKPQFETEAKYLDKGILKNEEHRMGIIANMKQWVKTELHFQDIQSSDSVLKGPKGNQETFLFARTE